MATAKKSTAKKTAAKKTAAPKTDETSTASAPAAAPAAAKAQPAKSGGFKPRLVHAYRREAHFALNKKGENVEHPVEVDVGPAHGGEKIKFMANDEGHVVGTVTTQAAFDRLTKGIPEAYIAYAGGDNVPDKGTNFAPQVTGKFVLTNGDKTLVLDDLNDENLKEFAKQNDVEVHPDLVGDDLRQAIYNRFQT